MQREYDGDPIDMTWNNGPWANDGETIDATEDTNGTVETTMSETEFDYDLTQAQSFKEPVPAWTVDAFRTEASNGKTATEIADERDGISAPKVGKILKGAVDIDGEPEQPRLEYDQYNRAWMPMPEPDQAEADDTADDADADAEPDADDSDPEPADIGWNPQPRQRQSNSKAIAALTAVVAIVAYLLGKRR